jgi:hypothetical protein
MNLCLILFNQGLIIFNPLFENFTCILIQPFTNTLTHFYWRAAVAQQ